MKRFKLLLITISLCLVGLFSQAQNKQVTGVVSDSNGSVPGVTVTEKGLATNGAATEIDGKYRITLKGTSGILIFKGVGYSPIEVAVNGRSVINITLEVSSKALDEVVVVGYGTQKKITLTGAQSAVSGSDIRENPSASLQNTLSGRITGFISQQRTGQPGGDGATFFLRGQNALNGINNPLIVVDDIEYSYDQFARIDPNEVESVTVLKDAAQTSIYGIKGANGVVVVTTRRGKTGKPQISVRSDFGISDFTKLPTYLDSYNTALLVNQANANDGAAATYSAQDLALYQNGQDPYGHPNNDWKKLLFKNYANQFKGTFDVQGGTEKTKYFVSLSYLNQGGNTKDYSQDQGYDGTYYNSRYNYRSNLDINVNKNLSLAIDAYGNIGEINKPNVYYNNVLGQKNDVFYEYTSFIGLSPMNYPIKNPDGSWGYSTAQSKASGYNAPNLIERLTYDGYNRDNENNMVLSASAKQKLDFVTKGLSIQGKIAYTNNYTSFLGVTRANLPSYIYNAAANTYALTDPTISRIEKLGTNYQPNGPVGVSGFPTLYGTQRRLTAQGILNYDRTFKDHHVNLLALYSLSSYTTGLDPNSVNYGNFNFIPNNTLGTTARLSYDYKQKYIVQLSGAYNGSNRFTGDKTFGLFPSASLAYNLAEEKFFKNNIKFIDQLKFRGSLGLVGSDVISNSFAYSYLQIYSLTNGNSGASSFGETNGSLPVNQGIQEGTLPNINVTWEKQRELNLGVDYSLFGGTITGLFDYFKNDRYDQLIDRTGVIVPGPSSVSAQLGAGLPPVNLGKTQTRGFEVELNFNGRIGKDFSFNFRGTYSNVVSKIIFRAEPTTQYPWQATTGHPIGAEALYHFIGYYKDAADIAASAKPANILVRPGDLKYQDLNGDGVIDGKDQAVSDITNVPTNNFGFSFGFKYKNFRFDMLLQGATNFRVRSVEEAIRAFSSNLSAVHQNSWTPALGDNATYPLLSITTRGVSDPSAYNSDYWSVSGNYLRLRTAEISYTLPVKFLQRLGLGTSRIYVSGNNLYTWSKAFNLYSIDPESNPGSAQLSYPPQRILNLGLSVTFK